MVTLRPFKGIRPTAALASMVATLPYDVLDSKEARELAADNPYSYLHIDKAEIDLDPDLAPYDPKVYQKAADNLQAFLEKGWLLQDDQPLYYLYELTMNGHSQTGLVGCTAITEYLEGTIKKHEFTRPEKELDRINHIKACDANTSPIFLSYRPRSEISQLVTDWKAQHDTLYDFVSFHEVRHRVWLVDEAQTITALQAAFQKVPALYIADGHHRTESAVKVGLEKQLTKKGAEGEFNYFLSIAFPEDQLNIWEYNRVLNVVLPEDFWARLAEKFIVTPAEKAKPDQPQHFGMYLEGSWYALTLRKEARREDPVAGLDVAYLQDYVFDALFGITDIRTDKRIDFVGGIRGTQELEKLVDRGSWNLAFSLYPTKMADLLNVADADKIMPPKSTWFEPKLLSGLFLHDLQS